ncbi:F-box/LRR-repeat/kelch-repeat protein At2g27520-like [Neltuma alba]|uniref:F-box/LRR-repeat/kelch-repeat protein At2g27520-like n=1 Tax=Neltuma alba TaxID=207710 RepID=UPI0010A3601F|nr:F-box/LRR-repeat/kelch-repeat protein At2g27520-like [Prosopis alba]
MAQMDGDNLVLPEDIMTNILTRLPVKSLIRFQCVCKRWKNLFKTPSFIAEHLHHSSRQNPSLLFEDFGKSDPFCMCLLNREMQVLEVSNDPFIDFMGLWVCTFDSCNGLLCVGVASFSRSLSLLLWNPATRKLSRVPTSVSYFEDEEFFVGFGFSPSVDDYKIVKIHVPGNTGRVNQVEVYSLTTGSWKEVEFGNLNGVAMTSNGFSYNGAIFWIGSKLGVEEDEDDIDLIVSFDIAMEVFILIPLPSSPFSVTNTPYPRYLAVYDNKLALLSHTLSEDFKSSLIHLWLMEEGTCASRERWIWTKKYTSCPYLGCLLVPVTIWKDEIVCNVSTLSGPLDNIEDDQQKIVFFNLTTNEFKTFHIRKSVMGYGIFNYVESLVSVGNIHTE